jgi:ATP synthase protein I
MSLLRRLDGPRGAPLAVLLAGGASAVGGAVAGVEGAPLAALVAAVVVLLFFWAGALPLLLVGGNLSLAGVGFLMLMMTYVLRLVGLVIALTVASRSDGVDTRWLALTVIGCTLVWVAAQVALVGRSRATL